MNKYQLIIFDLDGTMLDTSLGIFSSIEFAVNKMNFEMPSQEVLNTFIGPPIQDSFARVFSIEGETLEKISNFYRDHYRDIGIQKAVPYEGMLEMFKYCKENNIGTAVATYKRQDFTDTILENFGFDKYTDNICGSDVEGKLKKKDIIMNCIVNSGIEDFRKVVMVGDTMFDAIGAEEIEVDFIGVTYGFGFYSKEDVDKYKNVGYVDKIENLKHLI